MAVVPPNAQAGSLEELGRETRGAITDAHVMPRADYPVLRPDEVSRTRRMSREGWVWHHLDDRVACLDLFTSGTTGPHKTIAKTLRQLDEEVDGLDRQWKALIEARPTFATVSHHHIYGLLFRLLWPLCAGRCFSADTCLHADELVPRIREAGEACLATSPVHLRYLAQSEDFRKLGSACQPIFSSGGPLDETTADCVVSAFGDGVIEIFGSTETGGIAWRRQTEHPRLAWTPFPKVRVSQRGSDERLSVASPFVSAPDPDSPFLVEDRAELLADGRFLLLGRNDRTVKVGEKRIALPDLEQRLRTHAVVEDAALLLLPGRPHARVAAVVVLTRTGVATVARRGASAMTTELRRHLRRYCDPVAVPRRFRYVECLPYDPQGKVPQAALQALFDPPAEERLTAPETIGEARGEDWLEQRLRVPAALACLEGHFPDFPVVPGVVQLDWVMAAAQRVTGRAVRLASLDALKFKAVLRPGQVFHLRVDIARSRDALQFRLWSGETVFSSGRARVAAPDGDHR